MLMKNLAQILFLFVLIFINSCSKIEFETGIKGKVEFGSGDCMPIIDYDSRVYSDYSGKIYFIEKTKLDSLGQIDINEILKNSLSDDVINGNLLTELPPNTYIITLEKVEDLRKYEVKIEQGRVLSHDFKFWICTSY